MMMQLYPRNQNYCTVHTSTPVKGIIRIGRTRCGHQTTQAPDTAVPAADMWTEG